MLGLALTCSALAACGPAQEYATGTCLQIEADQDGKAVPADCTAHDTFKILKLMRNGGRPDCGYYMGGRGGAAWVTDLATAVTYCGPYND